MASGILTEFNSRILHSQQVAGASQFPVLENNLRTSPVPKQVQIPSDPGNEADAGDAALTSMLEVPGGTNDNFPTEEVSPEHLPGR
jgi:hypothetical protein